LNLFISCLNFVLRTRAMETSEVVATTTEQQQQQQQQRFGSGGKRFVSTIGCFGGDKSVVNFEEEDEEEGGDGAYVRYGFENEENPNEQNVNRGGGETYRKKHKPLTVFPFCDCEFQYRDYSWKKFTEYEPSRNGVEVREFYVVNMRGKECFTYAEGVVSGTRIETRFPFVCGEIVSSKRLASAGMLKNVYAWVHSTPEHTVAATYGTDERPLHVQQRQETSMNRSMISLPLAVDRHSLVVVFRTHGNSLFIQLMPTVRSEHKLIPGTPLFDKNNRGIRAAVGSMFSQYDYVVNCAPTEFCEIPIKKNKQGSDRLRIVCLDKRGFNANDRIQESKSHSTSILSLVGTGVVDAIIGSSSSSGGSSASKTAKGSNVPSLSDDTTSLSSNEMDTSNDNEIIYNGVVNEKLQITDSFTKDKKNKPPKSVVSMTIDDNGVSVEYIDEKEGLTFKWVNKDPKISYSIMPRRYFNAKANVIELNTMARTGKKEFSLKRFKSLERLI
jgi:hypothetical protein